MIATTQSEVAVAGAIRFRNKKDSAATKKDGVPTIVRPDLAPVAMRWLDGHRMEKDGEALKKLAGADLLPALEDERQRLSVAMGEALSSVRLDAGIQLTRRNMYRLTDAQLQALRLASLGGPMHIRTVLSLSVDLDRVPPDMQEQLAAMGATVEYKATDALHAAFTLNDAAREVAQVAGIAASFALSAK
jgi:hypothetical protein